MKKITFLLLLLSAVMQAQRFDWVSTGGYLNGANSFNGAMAIARDSQGNVYTIDSANGQQVCQGITAEPFSGGVTTFLYKFNAEGAIQYIKPIGVNFAPLNIQIGENDNLYLLGSLMGNSALKIGADTFVGVENRNYIIKFDPTGNLLWTAYNNVSGPLSQSPMLQFANNHIYFQSSNLSISKLDVNGQYVSTLTANSFVSNDSSPGVSFKGAGVLSNGDLVFAAISRGTITYGSTTLTSVIETGTFPLLLIRTNENLVFTWGNYFNGLGSPQQNNLPLTIGNDNGIYMGVMVNSTITAGTDTITNPGPGSTNYTDAILKVNDSGNGVWIKSVTTNTFALAMLNNPDGSGVFCGGEIVGFQPINLGSTTINYTNGNSFITKIDYDGVFQNSFAFVSGPGSYVRSLATNNIGDFYAGGKLKSTTIPTFSCIPREAHSGFYMAKFTEEPDAAPTPSISVIDNTLTASPVFTGNIQWFLNGEAITGANAQTYNATQIGNYAVTYALIPACISSSTVFNLTTLGIVKNNKNALSIHPNPSNGIFNIKTNNPIEKATLSVSDLNGRIVHQTNVETLENQSLDLNLLKNGMYILTISNKNYKYSQKIIKQ